MANLLSRWYLDIGLFDPEDGGEHVLPAKSADSQKDYMAS
jgi:hypothetical protein